MRYCPKCRTACEEKCLRCGSENLPEARENDPVFIITKDITWSAVVEDTLKKNGIPYLKEGVLGAGFAARVGYAAERYNFYVPFGAYIKSKKLLMNFFRDDFPE